MNASLKLLLYIFFVVVIFLFVQDRFSLFDIKIGDGVREKEVNVVDTQDWIEIFNSEGNSILVEVEVADTPLSKAVGLSGRQYLGDYEGMLFIMDTEDISPFWMKDMYISIDMIFIDTKGFIVDIKKSLTPCEAHFCPNILSSEPFKYVLEVNSGFTDTNRVQVGNSMIFNILSMD